MVPLPSIAAICLLGAIGFTQAEVTPLKVEDLKAIGELENDAFFKASAAGATRLKNASLVCKDFVPILQRFAEASRSWDSLTPGDEPEPPMISGLESIPGVRTNDAGRGQGGSGSGRGYWATFTAWFQAACSVAGDDDISALTDIFFAANREPHRTMPMFLSLAGLHIRRELAGIEAESPSLPPVVPDDAASWEDANKDTVSEQEGPHEDVDAPPPPAPEIVEAWRYARGVAKPLIDALGELDPKLRLHGYENDEQRFLALRQAALTNPTRSTALDATLLRWGGGCIIGDGYCEPQQEAIALLVWLRLRCFREAAGMALQIANNQSPDLDIAFENSTAAIECLHVLGIDPEKAFLGGMAGPVPRLTALRLFVDYQFQDSFRHCASSDGVRVLASVARALDPVKRRYLADLLREFVQPGDFAPESVRRSKAFERSTLLHNAKPLLCSTDYSLRTWARIPCKSKSSWCGISGGLKESIRSSRCSITGPVG